MSPHHLAREIDRWMDGWAGRQTDIKKIGPKKATEIYVPYCPVIRTKNMTHLFHSQKTYFKPALSNSDDRNSYMCNIYGSPLATCG